MKKNDYLCSTIINNKNNGKNKEKNKQGNVGVGYSAYC